MYGTQTPIDIHCTKLVDWLVQRRHCKKDWGENLSTIRRKIRAALKDMPENEEIKQILVRSKLDYFKSKQIIEILKTTEASSKNIFGYYSSQRMKDWQDIVYSYERDYIFIAENATDLIRETSYEVPGIRKVISNLKREKDETQKERANLLQKVQKFNAEYRNLAQVYGIEGVIIVQELTEKSKNLSNVMEEVANLSEGLKNGLEYYREVASSTSKQGVETIASMLHYVIEKGNTTVYEWKNGYPPENIEVVEKATSTSANSNSSEIEMVGDEIDFGEDIPSSDSSSGFVHVDKSDNGNGNIEETYIQVEGTDSRQACDSSDKTARGDDAKLVLAFRKSRNKFLNNLKEIEAFYVQLLNELTNLSDSSNLFLTDDSSIVKRFDPNDINAILAKISKILSIVNLEKNKILFQINDSPTFVESVREEFARKQKQASECTIKAELLSDHIRDLESQIKDTEVQLKRSIVSAKELQEKVERSISELYGGRSINIMGCVS